VLHSAPRNSASAAPQNQANCIAEKAARRAALCYAGLASKARSTPTTPHPQPPQNQLHPAECTCRKSCQKFAWWAAGCYAGFASKSLLKVRLRCKARHAEERAAFRSTPPTPRSTPLPQLRKINCSLQNAVAEKAA